MAIAWLFNLNNIKSVIFKNICIFAKVCAESIGKMVKFPYVVAKVHIYFKVSTTKCNKANARQSKFSNGECCRAILFTTTFFAAAHFFCVVNV